MAGVFISYRRDDSAGWAGRLATDLEGRFGADTVFQDIEAIGAGEDFVQAIDSALGSCSAALVLIGPEWAAIKGKHGARRLDDPADTVRLEVTQALQREAVLVIPVLLGGASMPEAGDLPRELEPLARRNALELSDTRWNYDLERLIETLTAHAGLVPTEKLPAAGSRPTRTLRRFALPGMALVAAMAVLTYLWLGPPRPATTFEVFSIDRPAPDEQLPLGTSQTWMLEGRLQLASGAPAEGDVPTIDVEVFTLPERHPVPQDGQVRLSTERGLWRFESARFAGEGDYEVLATVSFGDKSDWRSVNVECLSKGAAFRKAIENDRAVRGVGALIDATMDASQLAALKQELYALQEDFFRLFPGDLDGAEAKIVRTLDLLDPVLPSHPNDWFLQNLRAYAFKNYAMVMRNKGKVEAFDHALDEAESMFEIVRQQQPDDPAAWNGLGSVALLRGEPDHALVYIDRALEIQPDYGAARHDREIALQMLKERGVDGVNRRP